MPDPRLSPRGQEPAGATDSGAPERGFTLIELIVTMLILSIVMIVVLNSFTTIMTSQTRQASISKSQSQLALAFIALDQEVRYSTGITTPDQSGSDYYVEFQYWNPTNTAECAELQYSPGREPSSSGCGRCPLRARTRARVAGGSSPAGS